MKKATTSVLFLLTVIFLFPATIFAQILNGGFEQWTGNTPDNWLTDNAPSLYTPITQSNSSHSGSYSVKGQVVDFLSTAVVPILVAGTTGDGFSVSQKYLSLTGYYEFTPVGGDELVITVLMLNNSTLIGGGSVDIVNAASSFTYFSVGLEYFQELTPDTAMITITVGNSNDIHLNTEFKLDDLELSMTPTSVSAAPGVIPSTNVLNQNYPNPFNPSTTIGFLLPQNSVVSLTVYDVSGQMIEKLINRQNLAAGYHAIPWKPAAIIPSGVYFYRLETGSFSETKRMMFIK
jgi:hypothetical protein